MKRMRPSHETGLPQVRSFDRGEFGRAVLYAHLVLSPLLISIDTAEAVEYPRAALLILTSLLLAALGIHEWVGSGAWRDRVAVLKRSLSDPLTCGFVLFLFSAVASTVWSISPGLSFRGAPQSQAGLLTLAAYTVLFFATRRLCQTIGDCRQVLTAAVIGVAVTSSYALAQFANADPISWVDVATLERFYVRPFGTFGHPNFLAGYLAMALPLLAYFAGRRGRPAISLPVALIGAGGILVVLLTCSRAGWLAFLAAALIGGLGAGVLGARRKLIDTTATLVPLLVVACIIACRFSDYGGLGASLGRRLSALTAASSRVHIWDTAWALFCSHPIVGCGLDTFHLAFGQKRSATYWMTEWNTTPLRAHNPVLQILATQGVVGLAAGLVLLTGLGMSLRRAWRTGDPEQRALLAAIAAGLVAYLVQAGVSLTMVPHGTLLVTLVAVVSTLANRTESPSGCRSWGFHAGLGIAGIIFGAALIRNLAGGETVVTGRTLAGLLFILVVTGIAGMVVWHLCKRKDVTDTESWTVARTNTSTRLIQGLVWIVAIVLAIRCVLDPLRASLACRAGDRSIASDLVRGIKEYERATELSPDDEFYWGRLGAAVRENLGRAATVEERTRLARVGRDAFAHAARLVPINAYFHVGLGRMQMELARLHLARPDQALAEYERALDLDPNNAIYYGDAANSALVLNQLDRAEKFVDRGSERCPCFGLLHAHRGYVAYVRGNVTEAIQVVTQALSMEWYREISSRQFAEAFLEKAKRQMSSSHPAP